MTLHHIVWTLIGDKAGVIYDVGMKRFLTIAAILELLICVVTYVSFQRAQSNCSPGVACTLNHAQTFIGIFFVLLIVFVINLAVLAVQVRKSKK